jgi:hypothetical protein
VTIWYNDWADQADVKRWTDIVQVAAGAGHIVGLKSDGTVVAVGDNDWGQVDVGGWTDIVQVAAGYANTIGLTSDGTVVVVGPNWAGQTDMGGWTDIVQVAAVYGQVLDPNGSYWRTYAVGVKGDGTLVAAGNNDLGQLDVEAWTDIVQVATGYSQTIGLKSDGTVVATGENQYGQLNVGGWTDIVQVAVTGEFTVGLKSDGTVVAAGHIISENGFVIPGWHLSSFIPTPIVPVNILLPLSSSAVMDSDLEEAVPIGIGPLASNGPTLALQVKLGAFANPVDLYFGISIADVDPVNLCILKPDLKFQSHQDGIIPWKTNVRGSTSEMLFGQISISALPESTYYIYLAATQAGKDFSSGYYLWSTRFEIGTGGAPKWWQIFAFPVIVKDGCVCDFLWPKSMSAPR